LRWPLEADLTVNADGMAEGAHFFEAGLPLIDHTWVIHGKLLLHPHSLVLGKELFLHLALSLHECLHLVLYEIIKLSLLTKKR